MTAYARRTTLPFLPVLALALGCAAGGAKSDEVELPPDPPVPGAKLVNELIEPGEVHFKNLWQVTYEGQNAEAYWNYADDRLSMQITDQIEDPQDCDKIFVTSGDGSLRQVSSGEGVTTCSFFMPNDRAVLYASTHYGHAGCPQKPKKKQGDPYVWYVWPDYDIFVHDLQDGSERALLHQYGYDAEATVSPRGDRIVYTSTVTGDFELWTCDLDGGDRVQVTDTLGYDGGAFFNHAGDMLVFRTTEWDEENIAAQQAAYKEDLLRWRVKPNKMEIYTIRPDGSERTQVTHLGAAAFAPYFTPDDQRIIFSSNHGGGGFNFDLWMCDLDGSNLERVTTFDGPPGKQFDAFPMFSHDGRFLAFSSNRGPAKAGDTNVFIAEWAP